MKTKLLQKVIKLQKKAIQITYFIPFNSSNINNTCNNLKINKFEDFTLLQNNLFVKDYFEKEIFNPFSTTFKNQDLKILIECSAFKNFASLSKDNTGM